MLTGCLARCDLNIRLSFETGKVFIKSSGDNLGQN